MITAQQLNRGHALSRIDQPNVQGLADALASASRVTVVVGAGFSIDAGLPSWPALVESLARGIKPVDGIDVSRIALEESDDPMRKAEYVTRMRIKSDGYGVTEDLVRRALYDNHPDATPGPLLRALSSLVAALGGRVSILTTNFDEMIETALTDHNPPIESKAYMLSSLAAWKRAISGPRRSDVVPVFHLHGRVSRGHGEREDLVVLTESHFLRHGPAVRQVVSEALRHSATVFLGLSMTDPNLVGPLWDTRQERNPTYVVTVPPPIASETIETSRTYALEKNSYLEQMLHVSPIFLKSYGQLDQLMYEMVLAIKNPTRYRLPNSNKDCTAHGVRLKRILAEAYNETGCSPSYRAPNGKKSEALRERLNSYIGSERSPGVLGKKLRELASDDDIQERLTELMHQVDAAAPIAERFSLHLWLRVMSPRGASKARFAIKLIGSSDRSYRDDVSLLPAAAVEANSDNMAARAAARGKAQLWRLLPELSMGGVWRGVFAAPLRYIENVSMASEVVRIPCGIGAVSLHTTHAVKVKTEEIPAKSQVSFLSVTDVRQRQDLAATLEAVCQDLLKMSTPV